MSSSSVNVTITGAAGQIGYALVFRIAAGAMFGPNTRVNIRLLELPRSVSKLKGLIMELDDCAFPLLESVMCTDDIDEAMRETHWALLVGASPRKAGMERADLLKINGAIFAKQGKAINDNAAKDVRVLVVGNPCNTNAMIAMHHAPDIPRDRFYAMTSLDENRARAQLAIKAGVPVTDVSKMTIWGNHSATQYPDFHNALIQGKRATEVINDHQWLSGDFITTVQKRGAAIIEARGGSSVASAANGVITAVYNLVHDTPEGETYSMGVYSNGQYGIDEGLIFSFPCRTENGKCIVVEGVEQNDFGNQKIQATHSELKNEKVTVEELGLIA